MNKEYKTPALVIINLSTEDVIRTSGETKIFGDDYNPDGADFFIGSI